MKNKKKLILCIIIGIVLIVALIAIYFSFSKKKKTDNITINGVTVYKDMKGSIEEYDDTMYIEAYEGNYEKAYYITGTLNSEKDYDNMILVFDVKDRKGKVIGAAIAGINGVKKGGDYTFKALSTVKEGKLNKIHSFTLIDIRGE